MGGGHGPGTSSVATAPPHVRRVGGVDMYFRDLTRGPGPKLWRGLGVGFCTCRKRDVDEWKCERG